jgi:UDP-N-acetylmuramate-alanine ligase
VLCEIYDVAGRDDSEDQDISSRDLEQAILHHDADRGVKRVVEYTAHPEESLTALRRLRASGDVILVMGAGDVYLIASKVLE